MPACRHTEGPNHDCEYVDRRNAIIPIAEASARRKAFEQYGPDLSERHFSRLFVEEMDRLMRGGTNAKR